MYYGYNGVQGIAGYFFAFSDFDLDGISDSDDFDDDNDGIYDEWEGDIDTDGDGLGNPGSETLFCLDEVYNGWTLNCSDPEPNCVTNDTDSCGVCAGGNAADLGCGCFEVGPSGCDNTCGSTLEYDACGICNGSSETPELSDINYPPNIFFIGENRYLSLYPSSQQLDIVFSHSVLYESLSGINLSSISVAGPTP